MKATISKVSPLLVCVTLALGACAQRPTRDDRGQTTPPPAPRTAPATPSAPAAAPTPPAAATPATPASAPETPADAQRQFTGIEVCDEYLATYKSCHSVIGAYPVESLDERLSQLRATWQERAGDPAQLEALTAQCQNLTDTMKEALDGRDCPQPASDFVGADE
jgi:hypothetical protein